MFSQQPVILDFTQKNASKVVLPCAPLLSSYTMGWNDIQVEHHRQSAHAVPESCSVQHLIVIHHEQRSWTVERTLDGQFQVESSSRGHVVIVPAHVLHQISWVQAGEYTILALEPTRFARIAHETIDPDCAELVPHFATPDPLIHQIGLALIATLQNNLERSRLYAESMATALSAHLLQYYSSRHHTLRDYTSGLPKHKLRYVLEYIQAHLAEDVSLDRLAAQLGMSCYYFCRLFRQSTGITPHQYVIEQRLERAKGLLSRQKRTLAQPSHGVIAQIAVQVGFYDQGHLSRYFKKRFGVTPKQWLNASQ